MQGAWGQYKAAHYFQNSGGLNTADSPFVVADGECTGGRNFEYTLTGGFRKIKGATKVNSSADTALKTLGWGLHKTASGTKTVVRCADRKIQAVNLSTPSFTNLTEDTTAASSDILASSSTIPVVATQFNTTSVNTLWLAGGGMSLPYGVYSSTKVTKNGVAEPTGSISLATSADAGTPDFAATGYYRYAVAFRKTSTQAISNATLFKEVQVTTATDKVTITLSSISNVDTTKYDKFYIYRSAVSASSQGDTAFTTGDLIAQESISSTTYVDKGSYISTSQNVPQAGNTTLDNSVLPSGTYKTLTMWKRRLVTASDSTLYLSDVNKPESWPAANYFVIPSGGPITGLAVISLTTPTSATLDELLCVFKEDELWVLTGSSYSDWSLKQIDNVGCPNQSLIVPANGHLSWIDDRGVWIWGGSGKPMYASRKIADIFKEDGNVDKSKLNLGHGTFFKNRDQVIWTISTNTEGENLFQIKMDTRLTLPQVQSSLGGSQVDAVLLTDIPNRAYYASQAMKPSSEELLMLGDASGYVYKHFTAFSDADSAINFQYESKHLDMGLPGLTKRYLKVIAWCEDSSDATLTLQYWTQYTSGSSEAGQVQEQQAQQVQESYWDLAYWDSAYWDNTIRGFNPVVFNLDSQSIPTEGDAIKLRFKQTEANAPVTIAGFTVVWADVASRK